MANVTVEIKQESTGSDSSVEFNVKSDWNTAFNADITITNSTDKAFTSWELEFDFPHNITNIWNASIEEHSGNHYKIKNLSWNGNLEVDSSLSFGFGATPGGDITPPYNILLNGIPVDGPVANSDSITIDENTTATIKVLDNDTGVDILIIGVTEPENGTVNIEDNYLVYAPNTDYYGTDNFTYTIEDANQKQASASVTVSINHKLSPEEQPPIAEDENITVFVDTPITIDVLANDKAPNGGLRIKSSEQPQNGITSINDSKITYTPISGYIGNDSFQYTIEDTYGYTDTAIVNITVEERDEFDKIIVGNLHNWVLSGYDCPTIKLADVNPNYNVVHISFTTPADDSMTMQFSPDPGVESEKSFIQGVNKLHLEGRKVIISMGGAETRVLLTDDTKKQNFIDSMISIIEKYNFDGLDVDLESRSIVLDTGDYDFRNPSSVTIVNLIDAIRAIHQHFNKQGKDIWISLVPEVGHVQQGMEAYFDVYGSYLPVIYGLRDIMTYVAPQYMNVGSGNLIYALDGQRYQNGTPDFVVAMTEMLMQGFPVTNPSGETIQFPALREDQVGFATPATPIAAPAGGYMEPEEMYKALDYLTKGESFDGNYQLINKNGYPGIRGMVTWSINWDNSTDGGTEVDQFANSYSAYFNIYHDNNNTDDNISPEVSFITPAPGEIIYQYTLSPIEISINGTNSDGNITNYIIKVDGQTYTESSIDWTPSAFGNYIINASVEDDDGAGASASISVEIKKNEQQNEDKTPPTIEFTSVSDGQVIEMDSLLPITVSINATDTESDISSVKIDINGTTYEGESVTWTPPVFGNYTISATAQDSSGNLSILAITISIIQSGSDSDNNDDQNNDTTKKEIIGYITTWDAWKGSKYDIPMQGVYNHLNIDYSKYTTICYSFLGVAVDGSIHSGDLRNDDMYADQQPGELIMSDIYSSWEMWLLYGDIKYYYSIDSYLDNLGYRTNDWSTWYNVNTGETGTFPLLYSIENGASGLFKLCKENGVKLIVTIGGWSMSKHFPEMAADPTKKAKFLKDCKTLIDMGFDGIDIDWEFPGPFSGMNLTGTEADYPNFTSLMKDIRAVIGEDKILTAGFSSAEDKLKGFEWEKLNEYVDYYNIMTYDINGGWSDYAGHNSPLYTEDGKGSIDGVFKYLTKTLGIAPEKIILGVAFYGRGVETEENAYLGAPTYKTLKTFYTDGPAVAASDFESWPLFEGSPYYAYIKQNMSDWEYHWDDYAKVPYLTKGNHFLSYDNAESVRLKGQYINDCGAGGVLVWEVFGDMEFSGNIEYYNPTAKKLPVDQEVKTELLDSLYTELVK